MIFQWENSLNCLNNFFLILAAPEGENCNFEVGGYEGFVNRSSIPEDIIRNVTLKNQALECMWVVTVKPNWKVSSTNYIFQYLVRDEFFIWEFSAYFINLIKSQ